MAHLNHFYHSNTQIETKFFIEKDPFGESTKYFINLIKFNKYLKFIKSI